VPRLSDDDPLGVASTLRIAESLPTLHAIGVAERPDKVLYGTDWPLAPLPVYRDFVSQMFPEEFHQAVFHDNAKSPLKL
jgi:predicted TIM-barrel fold metal-dependent hydrolase